MMPHQDMLRRMGAGTPISEICQVAGIPNAEFHKWWHETNRQRLANLSGRLSAPVGSAVEIERDKWGIPHIYAESDADLFLGFGFAMAQDRLFQLDYLRRKGLGTLSEILGEQSVPSDLVARHVGLHRLATAEWKTLSESVRSLLQAFADGINLNIEQSGDLPIEFELLDYQPSPWNPVDSLAIENEFRWYLTGRFPVIVIPEVAWRAAGEGDSYSEFLLGEADEESIVQLDEFTPVADQTPEPVGHVMDGPDSGTGSNNWVVGGSRTASGLPLLASDPHIAFEAVSCWYESHLCGGSFDVAGMSYVGIPGFICGRNRRVAWGITNNICSQRDLYRERSDPDHPDCFQYDGKWEPARERNEEIRVRNGKPIKTTIRSSRNGPIVNSILPAPANNWEPISLKWLGAYHGGWLTAMLDMCRADHVESFRQALEPWHVPTFSAVFADVEGHIGFQASGRVPIRKLAERGLRPGWDPEHQWQGLIPFDCMPRLADPPRDWIASANNRLAPEGFPYALSGCWSGGWRACRIRELIESSENMTIEDMGRMQLDTKSLRAEQLVPHLARLLQDSEDPRIRHAVDALSSWDLHIRASSVQSTLFNVFFTRWCRAISVDRFGEHSELMSRACAGAATRLLSTGQADWFSADLQEAVEREFTGTLDYLTSRFGESPSDWSWGKLHQMPLRHVLASRGDLSMLLDGSGQDVDGDMITVCNSGEGPEWRATTGAGYRLITDLASSPPVLLAIDAQSQSGQPASPHYQDQYETWSRGGYHEIHLDRDAAQEFTVHRLTLTKEGDA